MNDYRELPEAVAGAYAQLLDAESRAHPDAWTCDFCRRTQTGRISEAEQLLLRALRSEFDPKMAAA